MSYFIMLNVKGNPVPCKKDGIVTLYPTKEKAHDAAVVNLKRYITNEGDRALGYLVFLWGLGDPNKVVEETPP